MIRLYLLRHGIPEDKGADPPLSADGITAMEREALGIARLGISFDLILSSPLRRAADTARIVAAAAGSQARLLIEQRLSGGCCTMALLDLLSDHPGSRSVLVVGHQPDMGRIAADLTGSDASLPFGKGTLCCLELAHDAGPGSAALVFLMPAGLLARAG